MRWLICIGFLLAGTRNACAGEGEKLYFTGADAKALIADGSVEVSASRFPCSNCHGEDALGKHEGATVIPALVWSVLAGKKGYDAEAFELAVTKGIDVDGNRLGEIMPRYVLNRPETDALIGFLKSLDISNSAGLSPTAVNFAPPTNLDTALGMQTAFDRINSGGAVFGRALTLNANVSSFSQTDILVEIVQKKQMQAEEKALIQLIKQIGIGRISLSSPTPEGIYELQRNGLVHDPDQPNILVLTAPFPSKMQGKTIYSSLSIAGPSIAKLGNAASHFILVGPDNGAIIETISQSQNDRFLVGYLTGQTIGKALLLEGRTVTGSALKQRLLHTDNLYSVQVWMPK